MIDAAIKRFKIPYFNAKAPIMISSATTTKRDFRMPSGMKTGEGCPILFEAKAAWPGPELPRIHEQ